MKGGIGDQEKLRKLCIYRGARVSKIREYDGAYLFCDQLGHP